MALTIKQWGRFQITSTTMQTIYEPISGKAGIVKSMRFANLHASSAAVVKVQVTRSGGSAKAVLIKSVPATDTYVDNNELTMEFGDKLEAALNSGSGATVDVVASGVERDQ